MKKRYFIILLFICIITIVAGITIDFHSYRNGTRQIEVEDKDIILSITTYDGKSETKPFLKVLGHSWISIDNRTDHEIQLLDYLIEPNEIVTCSIWAITNHYGVVFNLEPTFISQNGRYNGRKSLSMNISEAKLKDVGEFIQKNEYWRLTRNCSYWSIHLWNSIASKDYMLPTQTVVYTPTRLEKAFSEYTNITDNMDFSRAKKIFFYENNVRMEVELCK